MQLSEHDLKQLDEAAVNALDVESLRVLAVTLLADLKEAHDRLKQDPSNSSRPPSSQPPWDSSKGSDSQVPANDEHTDQPAALGPEDPVPSDASAEADETDGKKRFSNKPPGKPGDR